MPLYRAVSVLFSKKVPPVLPDALLRDLDHQIWLRYLDGETPEEIAASTADTVWLVWEVIDAYRRAYHRQSGQWPEGMAA